MEKENESSPRGNENKKQPEKSEKDKQKEAQIEINYVRLKNKPEVSEFLKPYNGDLTELFLKNYARRKNHWMEHRAYYEQRKEEKELELRDIAREAFTCLMKTKCQTCAESGVPAWWNCPEYQMPLILLPWWTMYFLFHGYRPSPKLTCSVCSIM